MPIKGEKINAAVSFGLAAAVCFCRMDFVNKIGDFVDKIVFWGDVGSGEPRSRFQSGDVGVMVGDGLENAVGAGPGGSEAYAIFGNHILPIGIPLGAPMAQAPVIPVADARLFLACLCDQGMLFIDC